LARRRREIEEVKFMIWIEKDATETGAETDATDAVLEKQRAGGRVRLRT
jgi:hypothetical protein